MISEKDIIDLLVHFERVIGMAKAYTQKPVDYGTGDLIYHSEGVLIKAVKNHPDKNISELSEMLFITKGAISQTTNKLIKRGYLRKFKFEDNKKEIYLKLTEKGLTVYNNVMASYGPAIQKLIEYFNKDEKKLADIHSFLNELENMPLS
jgi:DNA-binding MarR family transcriptional regulator